VTRRLPRSLDRRVRLGVCWLPAPGKQSVDSAANDVMLRLWSHSGLGEIRESKANQQRGEAQLGDELDGLPSSLGAYRRCRPSWLNFSSPLPGVRGHLKLSQPVWLAWRLHGDSPGCHSSTDRLQIGPGRWKFVTALCHMCDRRIDRLESVTRGSGGRASPGCRAVTWLAAALLSAAL